MSTPRSSSLAKAVERLALRDATLFADADIAEDRLGWIGLPAVAARNAEALAAYARETSARGITDIVLLGMGGSSLAALVLARVFGRRAGFPELHVLDTTRPSEVASLLDRLSLATTLVIVSSKSGTTIEPLSLADVLLARMTREGGEGAGGRFIAITDPGSPLESFAAERGFARVFHAPSDLGGRFAALSAYGMVPAALAGIDTGGIAAFATAAEDASRVPSPDNPAQALAEWLLDADEDGRDKITFVCSPGLAAFGLWAEQLIAESTGKRGAGILPVLETGPGLPAAHGRDRATFILRTPEDETLAGLPDRLPEGEPVFECIVDDPCALGSQFVLWEWAVALFCALSGIEPFDQPDVEEAKAAARLIVHGDPSPYAPTLHDGGIAITSGLSGTPTSLRDALARLLDSAEPGSYLALLAYLPDDDALLAPLRAALDRLSESAQIASTFEIGPRYLHSTGQFHKGGPDNGLFLVVTAADATDFDVPGAGFTLGRLHRAQSAGDTAALAAGGRSFVAVDLPAADAASIGALADTLESLC